MPTGQPPAETLARPGTVATSLASQRLGVPTVVYFVLSAAAPLTVVGGVVSTGFAVTGVTGIPLAFLVVAVVLAVFAVGYVAMARHLTNAGAFYAYITAGLGRPAGVAAAWVALLAYNGLQVGLYGGLGAVAPPLLASWFGLHVAWWTVALVAWALVAVLGQLRVDVNGRVLAVLLIAEISIILVLSAVEVAHPAGGAPSLTTLTPGNLATDGVGAVLALATLGFVGFESAVVFSEESRSPRRTVPLATYTSIALVGLVYAFASWAMTIAAGPGHIVASAQENGPETLFVLAGAHLDTVFVDVGHALFVTSLFAAMVSFHNTVARYAFALGRENVLPTWLGRTHVRTGAPRGASLAQSTVGLAVIALFAAMGWDPLVRLFFWSGTGGALGVITLLTATSAAVVVFFARRPVAEALWRRRLTPVVATALLGTVLVLTLANFDTLLGVDPGAPVRWAIPGAYLGLAVLGAAWALVLRARRPRVYATIGLGADAVTARAEAAVPARGGQA